MSLGRWLLKKYLLHKVRKLRKEARDMNLQTIISWLFNLKVVPNGYLTKAAGWGGLLTGILCLVGHPLTFLGPCGENPVTMITAGLAAVGLGRRGTQ